MYLPLGQLGSSSSRTGGTACITTPRRVAQVPSIFGMRLPTKAMSSQARLIERGIKVQLYAFYHPTQSPVNTACNPSLLNAGPKSKLVFTALFLNAAVKYGNNT